MERIYGNLGLRVTFVDMREVGRRLEVVRFSMGWKAERVAV